MCASAICLCAIVQILVFGAVHYTEARWTTVSVESEERNLAVVTPSVNPNQLNRPAINPAAAKGTRVHSRTDGYLRALSGVSITGGLIGVASMALLSMLGVAVAAGACIPGIHHTVRASVWALIIAMACVPWGTIVPSAALPGMFSGYETLCDASDRVKVTG